MGMWIKQCHKPSPKSQFLKVVWLPFPSGCFIMVFSHITMVYMQQKKANQSPTIFYILSSPGWQTDGGNTVLSCSNVPGNAQFTYAVRPQLMIHSCWVYLADLRYFSKWSVRHSCMYGWRISYTSRWKITHPPPRNHRTIGQLLGFAWTLHISPGGQTWQLKIPYRRGFLMEKSSTNGEFSSAMLDYSVCRKQLKQLGTIPPARNEFGQMDHVLFADACSVISLNGARKRRNPVLRVEME